MNNILRSLILIVFLNGYLHAQSLNPGAIAFLSFQTNAPDGFAFVTLQDLPPLTTINFTDNGWDGTAFLTGEETMQWSSPVTVLPAGTVVQVRDNSGTQQLIGPGLISGGLPNLSSGGDQVLAYVGAASTPQFIAGITNSNWLTTCNTTYQANTTCLPTPLVNGITAQSPVNSETVTTNMYFELGEFNGTPDQIRAALMNWNNWTISNDIAAAGYTAWPDWEFSVVPPAPLNLSVDVQTVLLTEGAAGLSLEFALDGAAYGNQRVGLVATGMLASGDFSSIPTFYNDTLWLEFTSGSNAVTVDLAAVEDLISEGTESGTLTPVSYSSGIIPNPNQATVSVTIEELQGISLVQFSTESQSIAEGDVLNITLSITPPLAESGNFTLNLSPGAMLDSLDYSIEPEAVNQSIVVEVPAGVNEFSFQLSVSNDAFPEATEVLGMYIAEAGSGLLVGGNSEIEISVAENDQENIPVGIYLNEVMADNDTTITDENGIYSDWIELYNAGGGVTNLEGLYISDDVLEPYKYRFSSLDLMPGSFTLLWADDSTELGNRHLNFRLSASGEPLFLFAAADNPVLIDSMNIPALVADQSYGSPQNGNQNRQIFDVGLTTPAASNITSGTLQLDQFSGLRVFPNPTSGITILRFSEVLAQGTVVSILNAEGKLVLTSYGSELDIACLAAGFYLVCLQSEGKVYAEKLIVN